VTLRVWRHTESVTSEVAGCKTDAAMQNLAKTCLTRMGLTEQTAVDFKRQPIDRFGKNSRRRVSRILHIVSLNM